MPGIGLTDVHSSYELVISGNIICMDKVPLRAVVGLKSGGCRKFKWGNAGVPIYLVCFWADARFAGVVPLLYCAGAVEFQKKCRLESSSSLCRMARPQTHTRMQTEEPFAAVKKKERKRRPLLYHDCRSVIVVSLILIAEVLLIE